MLIYYVFASILVNSIASDVKVKQKLSEVNLDNVSSSTISQDGSQVDDIMSGKSSPMVSKY